jgi:uncharacterized protein (DUF983 family)
MAGGGVPVLKAGLLCRCPRCGEGRLFSGFLAVPEACASCALDFRAFDPGDGPAVFVMLIVGFVVVAAALVVEVKYQPPMWLHMALWLPLIVFLSLGLLRPFKATLIALQFRNKASQHRAFD